MISLYDILEPANGQLFGEPDAHLFTDFCLDAASAQPSQLYVTLKTDRGDTHHYIEEAIDNGATGVLCTRPPDCDTTGVSVVLVRNTVDALLTWSRVVLGKLGTKVIGVAGSSGKTMTVQAIARVLGLSSTVHADLDEYTGPLGIPLALAQLKPEHDYAVLKLDVRQPGDMAEMVQAVEPDVGVVTISTTLAPMSSKSRQRSPPKRAFSFSISRRPEWPF